MTSDEKYWFERGKRDGDRGGYDRGYREGEVDGEVEFSIDLGGATVAELKQAFETLGKVVVTL